MIHSKLAALTDSLFQFFGEEGLLPPHRLVPIELP